MKERNLDGIYIRVCHQGRWQSRCLTDCTWAEVQSWTDTMTKEGIIRTLRHFHERLRTLGDELDIVSGGPEEPITPAEASA
jgi:hypothetical protein